MNGVNLAELCLAAGAGGLGVYCLLQRADRHRGRSRLGAMFFGVSLACLAMWISNNFANATGQHGGGYRHVALLVLLVTGCLSGAVATISATEQAATIKWGLLTILMIGAIVLLANSVPLAVVVLIVGAGGVVASWSVVPTCTDFASVTSEPSVNYEPFLVCLMGGVLSCSLVVALAETVGGHRPTLTMRSNSQLPTKQLSAEAFDPVNPSVGTHFVSSLELGEALFSRHVVAVLAVAVVFLLAIVTTVLVLKPIGGPTA